MKYAGLLEDEYFFLVDWSEGIPEPEQSSPDMEDEDEAEPEQDDESDNEPSDDWEEEYELGDKDDEEGESDDTGEEEEYKYDYTPRDEVPVYDFTETHTNNQIVTKFEDVTSFLHYLEEPCVSALECSSVKTEPSMHWDMNCNLDKAIRLAREGWPEGLETISRFTNSLLTTLSGQIPLPEVEYNVTGTTLDIARWVMDVPEDFMSLVDSNFLVDATPPKIIRMVLNQCVSWTIDAKTLMMRGAAAAALASILELHGSRVIIDIVGANRGGYRSASNGLETWIRVKEAHEDLGLERLAFMLAHPASFRRLMFRAWEHQPEVIRKDFGFQEHAGYGQVGETADRGDVYISGIESAFTIGEAATVNWIKQQMLAQGIQVEVKPEAEFARSGRQW